MTNQTYLFLLSSLRSINNVFMFGFFYFAVFNHMIKMGYYKTPMPKNEERITLYHSTWMMIAWICTSFLLIGIEMTNPFNITQ